MRKWTEAVSELLRRGREFLYARSLLRCGWRVRPRLMMERVVWTLMRWNVWSLTRFTRYVLHTDVLPCHARHPFATLHQDSNLQKLTICCEQNHMKGYIARDRGIVVLSKTGAFPGTGV